ncbi:MAG: L-lactate permease [Moorella humiferrea]|nr:L-lactate permease [Moorella humiferrea]
MEIPVNFFTWILALTPILVILILMVGYKWSAAKAGPVSWFVALIVSIAVFKADFKLLAFSNAKGMVMAFYVLYIIWGALFIYHVVDEVGGIETIGATFMHMTRNRVFQLMMIGVAFVTFLQGVAGFGVPVAVGAPLLAGLGFDPVIAVAVPLIGHSWSVTFGDMASSFASIQKATGLNGADLAPWAATFTGIAGLFGAFFAVHCFGGFKAIKQNWLGIFIIALSMSITQFLVALWEPTLATFIAGIVGMIVTAVIAKLPMYNTPEMQYAGEAATTAEAPVGKTVTAKMGFNLAFAAYYALIIIVAAVEFISPLSNFLKRLPTLVLKFDKYATGYNWVTQAGSSTSVALFGHPGALLIYAGIVGIIIYAAAGVWKGEHLGKVLNKVVKDGVNSSIATTSMVLMAFMMVESGMTFTLAKGVANTLGVIYPILTPLVGVLGAFMTGSNTNSNVMFGAFQTQVAKLLGVSTLIMAAAQTAGGSIGSMLAPAKVIVGTSTMGLTGREGEVIGKTLKYCVILALLLGILAWLMLFIFFRHIY